MAPFGELPSVLLTGEYPLRRAIYDTRLDAAPSPVAGPLGGPGRHPTDVGIAHDRGRGQNMPVFVDEEAGADAMRRNKRQNIDLDLALGVNLDDGILRVLINGCDFLVDGFQQAGCQDDRRSAGNKQ